MAQIEAGVKVWITKYADKNDLGTVLGPSRLGEGCWLVEFPIHKTDQVIRIPYHESELTIHQDLMEGSATVDVFKGLAQRVTEIAGPVNCMMCKQPMEKVLITFNPRAYQRLCTNMDCVSNQMRN